MRKPTVRVTRAINRLFVPRLRDGGFGFVVEETATQWKEGEYFRRSRNSREEVIRIGSMKFGGRLGLNIAAEATDGTYKYFAWDKNGLDPADLKYSNQEELESALLRVIYFLETTGFPWLDSQMARSG